MTPEQELALDTYEKARSARVKEVFAYLDEMRKKHWLHWCGADPNCPVFGDACGCRGCVDKSKVTADEYINYLQCKIIKYESI